MKNGMVTVVLPIYNIEPYIDRCVNSVVSQTYQKLEIILVDDGSQDHCPQICDMWAEKDSRIKVIHKKNAGLGMARNTGIEHASGEFICFFDGDDYIAADTIEKTYQVAKITKSEVVLFGFSHVKKNGKIKAVIPHISQTVYQGKEVQEKFLPNLIAPDPMTGEKLNLWMSMCMGLFSLKLINREKWHLVSEREIISEDVYSLLFLYKSVERVAILPEALYFYCENDSSLTHTYRKDRYEKIKYFYDECIKACDVLNYNNEIKQRLTHPYVSFTIAALKIIVSSNSRRSEKINEIKRILNDMHLQNILKDIRINKKEKARRIFVLLMKWKLYQICYLLIQLKLRYE